MLSFAAHAVKAGALKAELQTAAGEQATADLVAACSKDVANKVFVARLSEPLNRLQPHEFVCWTRRFLQLPPLLRLGNARARRGFDYHMETCLGSHAAEEDAWLDLYGGHDNGNCAPTMHGKHKGHTLLKWAVHRLAKQVPRVRCIVEPETHKVLLSQFSKQQCRALFPKRPSKKRSKDIARVLEALEEVRAMPEGSDREAKYREVLKQLNALNNNNKQEEKKAVRLDIQLLHRDDELLVDGTLVHSMTKTGKQAEAKRTWERLLSDITAVRDKPAAAIDSARTKKFTTYNPLLCIIKKQVLDKRRRKEPKFTPLAVTTFGEFGPGAVVVQEWLAMRLKADLEATLQTVGQRPDGRTPAQLTGVFRARFRMALLMVAVRRAAACQQGSGLPSSCVRGAALRR